MRFQILSVFALSIAASAASAAPSFLQICMNTQDPATRNTIGIMMEAVKVDTQPTGRNCALAETRLKELAEIRLSATRYTGPYEYRALNPLKTIEPIKTLPNLKKVALRVHDVDLSPLTELPQLEDLEVGGESIGFAVKVKIDAAPLATLKAIKRLSFHTHSMQRVRNIGHIAKLTTLEDLDISFQNVMDSSVVANLTKLRKLSIRSNPLKDLSGLALLTELEELDIGYVPAQDLRPLANLKKLRDLSADGVGARDITAIAGLTRLEKLNLGNNHISSLDALSGLSRLKALSIFANHELTSIEGLRALPLEELFLVEDRLTDISVLGAIQTLKLLDLERNRIVDVRPLAGLKNLVDLRLAKNQIADASPLGAIGSLRALNVGENKLTTLVGLEPLQLEDLTVYYNEIPSLEPIAKMTTLKRLAINGNPIPSVAPLAGLINLESLFALGLPACDFSEIAHLKAPHANSQGKIIQTMILDDTGINCR